MPPKKGTKEEPKLLLGRPKGNLKMGLVGLPNVGKSTTFNLLCKQSVPAENFPFCTINPHEARMNVPDERFKYFCDKFKPSSEVPANLTIFDIAGLVPGAHQGEGLGNAFLSHIAAVDGIYHVVRAFDDSEVIHSQGEVNPLADLQTIHDELRLKDIEKCERAIEDAAKVLGRSNDKSKKLEMETLRVVLAYLQEGHWVSEKNWKTSEVEILNDFLFLTAKPVVYLVNLSKKDFIRKKNSWLAKIAGWVNEHIQGTIIPYSAEFEAELAEIEGEAAKKEYIQRSGAEKSMLDKIVATGYSSINLLHFYTCGEKEVKCWTVRSGTKAPQAAGSIHTDFEKGFICAEVYKYQDYVEHGNEQSIKLAGKLMQKGKDYVVEDGDVMLFKFN